jgi:hypothetical protein
MMTNPNDTAANVRTQRQQLASRDSLRKFAAEAESSIDNLQESVRQPSGGRAESGRAYSRVVAEVAETLQDKVRDAFQ